VSWCPDPSTCKASGGCCGPIASGYPLRTKDVEVENTCLVGERFGEPCISCQTGASREDDAT
jgi:hypothetical protein